MLYYKYGVRLNWPNILLSVGGDSEDLFLFNCEKKKFFKITSLKAARRVRSELRKIQSQEDDHLSIAANIDRLLFKKTGYTEIAWAKFILAGDSAYSSRLDKESLRVYARNLSRKRIYRLDLIQAVNLPSSGLNRTRFALEKKFLSAGFIGDDDFLHSIFIQGGVGCTVFDIDSELTALCRENGARSYHLNLLDAIPQEFNSSFDVVYTDPPCARNWIRVFLTRALYICKVGGYISVACNVSGRCYIESFAKDNALEITHEVDEKNRYQSLVGGVMNYESVQWYMRVLKKEGPQSNPWFPREGFLESGEITE